MTFWKMNALVIICLLALICVLDARKKSKSNKNRENNSPKLMKNNKNQLSKNKEISEYFSNIYKSIKSGNIHNKHISKKLKNKLQKQKQKFKEILNEKEIIKGMLNKRLDKEREKEKKLILNQHKEKELKLLQIVDQKIIDMKQNEVNQFKKLFKREIEKQKDKANSEALQMLKLLSKENKLTSYNECINDRLYSFDNESYIYDLCNRNFDNNDDLNKCMKKDNFCEMCCSYHIGSKFYSKLAECKTQCEEIVNGDDESEL